MKKKTKKPTKTTFGSELRSWDVIEVYDTWVPKKILKAIERDQEDREDGYVYSLMWKDALLFHGEDGWCLRDATLDVAEDWLEKHREQHGLDKRSAFWFRIKVGQMCTTNERLAQALEIIQEDLIPWAQADIEAGLESGASLDQIDDDRARLASLRGAEQCLLKAKRN